MAFDVSAAAKKYLPDALRDIKRLVAIESVQGEAKEGKPFGEGVDRALQEALKISRELGMETANVDGYVGYAQIGEGEKLIGIVGHLDCVPLGEGWEHDPLGGEIVDGVIYGRGVSDDKGPSIAALYAMKILMDSGVKLNSRIRFVFGTNEETGMAGVDYYLAKEGDFDMGFTSDAGFPLCFGEKGGYHGHFSGATNTEGAKVKILSVKGGMAVNVVYDKVVLTCNAGQYAEALKASFVEYAKAADMTCQVEDEGENTLLTLNGKAAHASTPELGVNAISYLMKFVAECELFDSPFAKGYAKVIGLDYSGANCGMKMADEYGELTFNVGIIGGTDFSTYATIDIRYPLTLTAPEFKVKADEMEKTIIQAGLNMDGSGMGKSLYKAPDSPMINALYDAYVKVTQDTVNKPFTMGGGTYAKHFDSIVAFGAGFPNEESGAHMANEHVDVESIQKCMEIYTHALMNLLAL